MRRLRGIFVILLAVCCLLTACQPTPQEEIVINRGDKVMEEKIAASAEPTVMPGAPVPTEVTRVYNFPARWEETYAVSDKLTLRFEADVTQKEDGMYPVYSLREKEFTGEEAQALLEAFLPAQPVRLEALGDVKADWKRRMEDYMETVSEQQERQSLPENQRGDGDDTVFTEEEIKEQMAWFQEQMDAAPESHDSRPVTDYSDVKPFFQGAYTLEDGSVANVTLWETGLTVFKGVKEYEVMAGKDFVEENPGYRWQEADIALEAAEQAGRQMLKTLDMEGFSLLTAKEQNVYAGEHTPLTAGWTLTYVRDFGGYPLLTSVRPSERLKYGEGDGYMVNKRIMEEQLTLFVNGDGVQRLSYWNPKEILRLENSGVELLDWEQVQERAKQAFGWCLVPYNEDYGYTYSVYKAVLTCHILRQADSEDYYAVPCWVFYFDEGDEWPLKQRAEGNVLIEALYINAIDGSIVHTEKWDYALD